MEQRLIERKVQWHHQVHSLQHQTTNLQPQVIGQCRIAKHHEGGKKFVIKESENLDLTEDSVRGRTHIIPTLREMTTLKALNANWSAKMFSTISVKTDASFNIYILMEHCGDSLEKVWENMQLNELQGLSI